MTARASACAWLLILALLPSGAGAADAVEGKDAVFAERGLVILWAILRGEDEASTSAVIRILPLDARAAAYVAEAVDSRTQERRVLVAAKPLEAWEEMRISRGAITERTRTELHFAGRLEDSLAGRHALTVFFVGMPPTTPEVTTEAALSAYFAGALNRARQRPAGPPPR
jgi:hypothetical protein